MKQPTKAQMAKQERQWRAESLVKEAIMQTPQAKKQVKDVMRELAAVKIKVVRKAK